MNARAVVLVVICVIAAAMLMAARQPSRRAGVATPDAPRPDTPRTDTQPDKPAAAAGLVTKNPLPSKTPAARVETEAHAASGNTPAVESALAPVAPANAPAVDATPKADVQQSPAVTITGCIELDEKTFWLKDTAGANAPKSRSWKSGFLKKRSSSIVLIDAANTLHLPTYVGQRVAATGMLTNREMRARSLQRVAASCN